MSKELNAKKKDELVRICKERGLPISGTKAILISRILGEAKPKQSPVVPKCYKVISEKYIHATLNEHGNYEDPISHLVFEKDTGNVLGKQVGAVLSKLSIDDVKFCREKGLHFSAEIFDGNFALKDEDIEETVERLIANAENVSDDEDDEEAED